MPGKAPRRPHILSIPPAEWAPTRIFHTFREGFLSQSAQSQDTEPNMMSALWPLCPGRFDRLKALSRSKGSVPSVTHALVSFSVNYPG